MKKSIKNFAKQSIVANQQMQLKGGCCPNPSAGPTPTPTPYPPGGAGSNGGSTSVPIDVKPVTTGSGKYSTSSGDEPGTAKGAVSSKIGGEFTVIFGFAVKIPKPNEL